MFTIEGGQAPGNDDDDGYRLGFRVWGLSENKNEGKKKWREAQRRREQCHLPRTLNTLESKPFDGFGGLRASEILNPKPRAHCN